MKYPYRIGTILRIKIGYRDHVPELLIVISDPKPCPNSMYFTFFSFNLSTKKIKEYQEVLKPSYLQTFRIFA